MRVPGGSGIDTSSALPSARTLATENVGLVIPQPLTERATGSLETHRCAGRLRRRVLRARPPDRRVNSIELRYASAQLRVPAPRSRVPSRTIAHRAPENRGTRG